MNGTDIKEIFEKHYNYQEIQIMTPQQFKDDVLSYNPNLKQTTFLNLPDGYDISNFEQFFYPIYPDFHVMLASKKMYSRTKHIVVAYYEKAGLTFIPLPEIGNEKISSLVKELGFVMSPRYFSELKEYDFINLLQIHDSKFHNVFSGLVEPYYEKHILCKNLLEIIVTETYVDDNHILNLKIFGKDCLIKQDSFKFDVSEKDMKKIINNYLLPFILTKDEIREFKIEPSITSDFCSNFEATDEMKKIVNK